MDQPLLEAQRGAVTLLTLNRPATRNALDEPLVTALGAALERARNDASTRVVVLGGAGGAFCSGVDLGSAAADLDRPDRVRARLEGFHALIRAVTSIEKPVLAAVDGPAVGFGADLAFACDLRLASDAAYFEEKFVSIGLMPDGGGTFHLPRLIGLGRALESMMLGTRIDANKALELGLVNRIAESSALAEEALSVAEKLASGPPLALAAIKKTARENLNATLDEALDRERERQLDLLSSADVREGVTAFLERRQAVFRGK